MRKSLTTIGKLIAFEYLRSLGYVLVDRSFRKSHYYIDFVMKRLDGSIRFVNVTTVESEKYSVKDTAQEKKNYLLRSSQVWLENREYVGSDFGWDYLGVNISKNNRLKKVIYVQDFLF
ncbi:MAG: YraN family protein [bacterium]